VLSLFAAKNGNCIALGWFAETRLPVPQSWKMLATRAFTASRVGPARVLGPQRVAIAPVARPLESSSFMGGEW
jgi:hypothetical protein